MQPGLAPGPLAMRIKLRLYLSFGVIALAVAGAGGIAIYQQVQVAHVVAVRDAQHLAADIAHAITYELPDRKPSQIINDPALLQAYTRSLYGLDGRDIEVVNDALTIMADRDTREIGSKESRPAIGQTVADGISRDFFEEDPGTRVQIREVVVPIKGQGRTLGAIVLEYTPLYVEVMSRAFRTIEVLAGVMLGTLLLALTLGALTSRAILRPIRALEKGLTAVARGEVSTHVQTRSADELGKLITAFNSMADDLEKSKAELILAREHATSILRSAGEGLIGVGTRGEITFINPAASRLLNADEDDGTLVGQPLHAIVCRVGPDGAPVQWQDSPFFATLRQGVHRHVVGELFWRKDGTSFPTEFISTPIRKNGAITGAVITFSDITRRVQAEDTLAQANNEANRSRREIFLLHQMGELLQSCATLDEAYGVFQAMVAQFFPDDAGAVYVIAASRNIAEAMVTWGPQPLQNGSAVFSPDECWALRRGRPHYVEDQTSGLVCKHLPSPPPSASLCIPLVAHGEALGVFYLAPVVGTSAALSEAKQRLASTVAEPLALALANLKLRETLRNQSIRDPLTGLFNRRYLEETFERELRRAERTHHPVGVITFDIDLFKQFNDTFGHDAGDAVLSEIGASMRRNFRQEDILCRYGGEEFTVILPESNLEITKMRAEQLRKAVAELNVTHRGQALGSVTLSLGVAVFPDHGTTMETLLRAADNALYRAKEGGRARVEVALTHVK